MMMKSVGTLVWWTLLSQVLAVDRPPSIFLQPSQRVFYRHGDTLRLPCVANSSLPLTYTWTRNGLYFMPGGNDDRMVQVDDEGTLVFNRVEDKDEGIFQCTASNSLGRSLSHKVILMEAKLEDFVVRNAFTHTQSLGSPLTLDCVPPESIPWPPSVHWMLVNNIDGSIEAVNYDARVTMDLEYRLRFTNVQARDAMDGRAYACVVQNAVLGKVILGFHQFIRPVGSIAELRPASYLWASPEDDFGLRGQRYTAKCIFSGNPTPEVHWERIDGSSMPDRARIGSFGQELTIEDLQFEDAGTYRCRATNHLSGYPVYRSQRTISLRVESRPYWVQEPQDVQVGLWGTAEFTCGAKAVPEPQYFWLINGVPLHDVRDPIFTSDRFQRPSPDRIVFSHLFPADSMVIQCNATNKHGYVWADVYLSVTYTPFTLGPSPQTTNGLPNWSEAAGQRPIG